MRALQICRDCEGTCCAQCSAVVQNNVKSGAFEVPMAKDAARYYHASQSCIVGVYRSPPYLDDAAGMFGAAALGSCRAKPSLNPNGSPVRKPAWSDLPENLDWMHFVPEGQALRSAGAAS